MNAFIKLGVIEPLAQALYQQGIRIPTVIQQVSIPAIFKGKDIIGRSETGTGKTLAYLLPLVQRVDLKKGGTQVLIMTPTRELAKQIFDVLRGDMSLVGTRPPTVDEYKQYESHHKRRLSMKPGITGLWQVSGRSNIEDFEEVVKLDVTYIDNWSLWNDIKILFKTVYVVFAGRGAK